jgi:hypothetical protein
MGGPLWSAIDRGGLPDDIEELPDTGSWVVPLPMLDPTVMGRPPRGPTVRHSGKRGYDNLGRWPGCRLLGAGQCGCGALTTAGANLDQSGTCPRDRSIAPARIFGIVDAVPEFV